MEITEEFTVEAPLPEAWRLLRDPAVVTDCMPGAELLGTDEDGAYLGRIAVSFGPTMATFSGRAEFTVHDDDHRIEVTARGRDTGRRSRASASMAVQVRDEQGRTGVAVDGKIEVVGPLAGFAEMGGAHVARELLSAFSSCLGARLGGCEAEPAGGFRPVTMLWRVVRAWMSRVLQRILWRGGKRRAR